MLTALQLIKDLIKDAHETFESTVADIQPKHLQLDPGGKAFPLAGTYAHLIFSEDMIVQQMIQGKPTLYQTTWKDRTGASAPIPAYDQNWETAHHQWAKTVTLDLDQFRQYSQAVYAATDAYVNSLTEADLETEKDLGPMGKRTVANLLYAFVAGHAYSLTGEISVLKGIQGSKGYPF